MTDKNSAQGLHYFLVKYVCESCSRLKQVSRHLSFIYVNAVGPAGGVFL
jgi:hypothetical protein